MAKKQTNPQQSESRLQAKAQKAGIDWSLVQQLLNDYGPFVVQMVLSILEKLKSSQGKLKAKAAGCPDCPEELATALLDAHEKACAACCATCEACCVAGLHDHHPDDDDQNQSQSRGQHP